VRGTQRWKDNWRVVAPPGAVRVGLARRRGARSDVSGLPAGTPVVLVAGAPGALRRCRAFAAAANVAVEQQYLAFPSAQTPAYLVEDHPASLGLFVKTILAAPPGGVLVWPLAAGVAVLRAFHPWRLLRALAPGRVVVGRRQ
jgi:hypothetical protein